MTEEFKQYADQLKNQKLFELEELYQNCLEIYAPVFQTHFRQLCETLVKLQQDGSLGAISYLEYTLLFTNLVHENATAEVRVYNDDWYFDAGQQAVGSFDLSFLFTKYQELWKDLMSCRKRFGGAVTAHETIACLLSYASQFYKYVVSAFRFSILPCIEAEPFISVRRADEFEINIGEYMAYTEAIYKECKNRTAQKTLEWFAMREEYEYTFEDFTGLDLSGADLSEIDLRYADLRRTTLTGTDFQDAMLYGTRFCSASMQGADLRYCQLHESDFTDADLTNARFSYASGYRGVPDHTNWSITGYRSISFRNANLTNADFCKTRIHDADFTGAVMTGAKIDRKRLETFALSPQQRQAIQIIE
ncbi:MAG: pentapeptide repeat-containing protein [Eubacterium sp.]|nr:pentapeptide repeat-containing protein [Eubacterium sp.]